MQQFAQDVIVITLNKKKSFSNQWTAHRANWNRSKSKFDPEDISDECALYRHYYFNHKNNLENLNSKDAYEVAFWNNRVLRI